jgi:hypothetical protein
VFLGGGARPKARIQEPCGLAGIPPRTNFEIGKPEAWELKDLRKTCATYHDAHVPESSVEILGHPGEARHRRRHPGWVGDPDYDPQVWVAGGPGGGHRRLEVGGRGRRRGTRRRVRPADADQLEVLGPVVPTDASHDPAAGANEGGPTART